MKKEARKKGGCGRLFVFLFQDGEGRKGVRALVFFHMRLSKDFNFFIGISTSLNKNIPIIFTFPTFELYYEKKRRWLWLWTESQSDIGHLFFSGLLLVSLSSF